MKIDHSFTDDLSRNSADYAMVQSTHEIAHFMAMRTIAEQVDDDSTMDILHSIGVDLAMPPVTHHAVSLNEMS